MTADTLPPSLTPSLLLRWFRVALVGSGLIAAFVYLNSVGGPQLVIVGVLWPLGPAFGMVSGVHRASNEAWQKRSSLLTTVLVYSLLFCVILFPAIVALFISRVDIALALTVAIILALALIVRLAAVFGFPHTPHPSPLPAKPGRGDRKS